MQTLIRILFFLFTAVCLCSCHTPGSYMTPADMKKPLVSQGKHVYPNFIPITPDLLVNRQNPHEYRVGPQDILTIIVWNHPELTIPSMQTTSENVNIFTRLNDTNNNPTGILVDEYGKVFFPLAGKLKVAGLTVDQIRSHLAQRLTKYIRNPQVSVRVTAFRNKLVYILGEVARPGIQPITDMPMTLMDALNQAGGIDKESSDAHYIYVIRGNFIRPCVYWLDASSPGAVLMAENFQLRARDILLVTTAGVSRYSRVVNKILPTVQTFLNPPVNMRTDN